MLSHNKKETQSESLIEGSLDFGEDSEIEDSEREIQAELDVVT